MNDDRSDASGRRSRILTGARAAFLRFGFERASIADIAAGAGVSRTAVYHYFASKDEVLCAVVDEMHAATAQASRTVLDEQHAIGDVLIGLLDAKFGRTLALLHESPHGAELIDATHRLTGPATRIADAAFQALVVEALVQDGRKTDADAVADTIVAAAKGLLRSGTDLVSRKQYLERIGRLIHWAMY
jgi:AcrR family transcriptional regulator